MVHYQVPEFAGQKSKEVMPRNLKTMYHNRRVLHYNPHDSLILFGIFVLLQDLIVNNLEKWPLLFQSVKYVDEVFVTLGFLFFIVIPWLIKGKRPLKTGIEWLLSLFLLIGIISGIVARVPLFIVASQFLLYIKGFLFFYILASVPTNNLTLRKYVRSFAYVALLFLVLGFVDLVAPHWFRTITGNMGNEDFRGGILSAKSLFVHPGEFGWFMAFIALYCFAFYIVFQRPSYLFAGLVFSTGCFLSMRAKPLGGLVGGILGGLSTLTLSKKIRNGLVFVAIGICICVIIWPKLYGLYRQKISQYIEVKDPMLVARNALYITSVDIAKDYFPFGAGFGRYGSWMSRVHYSPLYDKYDLSEIHGLSREKPNFINDTFWPMVLGETGFIGFALYMTALILFMRTLYKQIKNTKDKYIKAFQLGTLMVLIESLIESLASPVYTRGPFVYLIFGAIGICYSLSNNPVTSK